jgi:hypothetical protein
MLYYIILHYITLLWSFLMLKNLLLSTSPSTYTSGYEETRGDEKGVRISSEK